MRPAPPPQVTPVILVAANPLAVVSIPVTPQPVSPRVQSSGGQQGPILKAVPQEVLLPGTLISQ